MAWAFYLFLLVFGLCQTPQEAGHTVKGVTLFLCVLFSLNPTIGIQRSKPKSHK